MRTVFVVTVFRRYHELRRNLERNLLLAQAELGQKPEVVLVWARPELSRQWVIDELVERGLVQHVLKRAELPQESTSGTSYPESVNLRRGLEFARDLARCPHCGSDEAMLVGMAADVELLPDTLRIMRKAVQDGDRAVVYHWANNCIHENVWHTNCFAVHSQFPDWWPPLSDVGQQDVLERQWGRQLERMERVCRGHNSGERRFLHRHSSEGLPPIPEIPVRAGSCMNIGLEGGSRGLFGLWASIQERIGGWLAGLYAWFAEPVFKGENGDGE